MRPLPSVSLSRDIGVIAFANLTDSVERHAIGNSAIPRWIDRDGDRDGVNFRSILAQFSRSRAMNTREEGRLRLSVSVKIVTWTGSGKLECRMREDSIKGSIKSEFNVLSTIFYFTLRCYIHYKFLSFFFF